MERIINYELVYYPLDNHLISNERHGCIRRRSTGSIRLECLQDDLNLYTSYGLMECQCSCDLTEALNRVTFGLKRGS